MRKFTLTFVLFIIAILIAACGPANLPANDNGLNTAPNSSAESPIEDKAATNAVDVDMANGSGELNWIYPANTTSRELTALGNPDAPVVIVEYSDYQCPFCRRHFQETMPQLKAEYIDTGRVYYVFKDYPLAGLHPLAYRLHEAALCTGEAGGSTAYWQAHNLFFAEAETFQRNTEAAIDEAVLEAFAAAELPDIQECLSAGRFADEVQQYIAEGQTLGLRGTPSFFINGSLFVGAQPFTAFQAAIEQAERGESIAEATAAPPPVLDAVPTPATIVSRPLTALGNPDAPVTIIEYSDFQCPFCRRHVQDTMPQLIENYIDTGRVYYVFKDFPIESLHPLAYRLHEAALCAGEEGGSAAYWRAHDLFFEQAEQFHAETIAAMDETILDEFSANDLPDISQCLATSKYADEVQTGVDEGRRLGVNGTPAFFVNGYPISGAQPYELFEYAIGLAEEGRLADAYRPTGPNDGKAQATAAAEATAAAGRPVEVPLSDEPAKGDPNAPVTIVEYSDYQCPFCLRHFEDTLPLLQEYIDAGQVRYVFKDYPIQSIHPQALKAHEAARCARELGGDEAYWTMHDLLFANQEAWASRPVPDHVAVLKNLAGEAGFNQDGFDECLDSGRYEEAVLAELAEGTQLGVRGTPAFFLDGRPLSGAQPFTVFQQAIEQLLAVEEVE